jgi:hypothetical protein
MRWTRQHGARLISPGEMNLVSDGRCARRAMLQRFRQDFGRSHMACRGMAEEAAYGEVVWFWHPLLMLSPWR